MNKYDFEEEKIKQTISKFNAKRVLLQMPQGLKPYAINLVKSIEDYGSSAIISIDPCYGACDIAVNEAEDLNADLIVHFGHSKMVTQTKIPALYVETHSKIQVENSIIQAKNLLTEYNRIGLTTSIQHIDELDNAKSLLTKLGKTVVIGNAGQLSYPGQVLGCNYSNAKSIADKVDAFLFIGGGLFHALGIALTTFKPTIIIDPYDNRAYLITAEAKKILNQRFTSIQTAKNAKTLGILIGLKPGQKHLEQALEVKTLAKKCGKSAFLLAGREINPDLLMDFPNIDAYINTACPRISLDTPRKFQKPILTVNEFMVVCGEYSWENLIKEGLFVS